MFPRTASIDQLEQVHELNRLFLTFLQCCVRDKVDCLGLPNGARPALCSASGVLLEAVAEFPRALFQISLDDRGAADVRDLKSRVQSARQSMNLTILLCAWTFSRQSVYQARFLLGLEAHAIQQLRTLQLTDLQRFALAPQLVLCAFPHREWLWIELLTETRPEARRQLALIALQPGLEQEWPAGKSAQLS